MCKEAAYGLRIMLTDKLSLEILHDLGPRTMRTTRTKRVMRGAIVLRIGVLQAAIPRAGCEEFTPLVALAMTRPRRHFALHPRCPCGS